MSRVSRMRTAVVLPVLLFVISLTAVLLAARPAWSQEKLPDQAKMQDFLNRLKSIPWQKGRGVGQIGMQATIEIPPGYQLTGKQGAAMWLELNENPPDPTVDAVFMPVGLGDWFLVFSYRDDGHVADDEGANLDADAILESIKAGTAAGNEERRSRGWEELEIVGWIHPPAYDPVTKRLSWSTRGRGRARQDEFANLHTRLLGRTGVMSVQLVASPDRIDALVPTVNKLLGNFQYTSGNKYGEWRAGDKMAAYGLTGLITGGAAVAAAKAGLLGKLGVLIAKGGKAIFLAVAALAAGLWRLLTGRKRQSAS